MTIVQQEHAALLAWQQSLLVALWAPTHDAALRQLGNDAGPENRFLWRGLAAYRSHASGLAERALRAVYPVLARLLGEEDFCGLARWHWQMMPPASGDMARWGEALPVHLQELPELMADQPWLPDVARTEWALHCAATAADASQDPSTFALLASTEPAQLRLHFAPGLHTLSSVWPVVTLMHAGSGGPMPGQPGETALVWRCGWRPAVREAQAGEAPFLQMLQQGQSLAAALTAAPELDFATWLPPAVNDGLLLRVRAVA